MDRDGFRTYLRGREIPEDEIDRSIAAVEQFEAFVRRTGAGGDLAAATERDVNAFSAALVAEGRNTWETYVALARHARLIGNHRIYVAVLEYVDGFEALENLFKRLEDELGREERDRIFDGVALLPLGTPNDRKFPAMRVAVRRLEETVGHERCAAILGAGLRDLPDASFAEEKTRYERAGGIDAYLEVKGREAIAQLEKIRDEKTLFFTQPITDAVIEYVRSQPEILRGVRRGSTIYETKIPYLTAEFLAETDPQKKAHLSCHCPWARESLRRGEPRVPATFCHCSAAFHKKPYEVIFGRPLRAEVLESVLNGDPRCRFAIHLPDGVA